MKKLQILIFIINIFGIGLNLLLNIIDNNIDAIMGWLIALLWCMLCFGLYYFNDRIMRGYKKLVDEYEEFFHMTTTKGIQIKNRFNGDVIYSSSKTNIKDALEEAVNNKADLLEADLLEADLLGADLSGADLKAIKQITQEEYAKKNNKTIEANK